MEAILSAALIVLVVGGYFYIDVLVGRRQMEELAKAWSELAQKTGLEFNPGSRHMWDNNPPSLHGEYRGRALSLTRAIAGKGTGDNDVPAVYTITSLPVNNPANLSLTIEKEWFLPYSKVKGSPRVLADRVAELVAPHETLLWNRPPGTTQITDGAWTGTNWDSPSFKLEGSELICRQAGVLTNVQLQMVFLDLLCDLAELAEAMQPQVVVAAD